MCEDRGSKMDRVIKLLASMEGKLDDLVFLWERGAGMSDTSRKAIKEPLNTTNVTISPFRPGDVVFYKARGTYHAVRNIRFDNRRWYVQFFDSHAWFEASLMEIYLPVVPK